MKFLGLSQLTLIASLVLICIETLSKDDCLGEHDTEERDGEYKATVSSYKLHPRFKKTLNSLVFDFALIEIPPVDLRKYRKSVGPICLPTKSGTPVNYGRGRATAYGWGKETKVFQDTLRYFTRGNSSI